MKKKIVLMVTSLVLVVAMAVGGTLAYLTAQADEVVNTFTVGNIQMELEEPAWVDNSLIYPGAEIAKDPTVTILANSEECYVRMFVKVNNSGTFDGILANANLGEIFGGYDSAVWAYAGNVEDTAADTRTYEFRYVGTVAKSASDAELAPLFEEVLIPTDLSETDLAELEDFQMTIWAHAIQKATFNNADEAWAAFDVQN